MRIIYSTLSHSSNITYNDEPIILSSCQIGLKKLEIPDRGVIITIATWNVKRLSTQDLYNTYLLLTVKLTADNN